MKKDFNKAIREIQAMRMTASERDALRTRVIRSTFGSESATGGAELDAGSRKYGSAKSPWNMYSFGSWFSTNKTGAIAVAAIALVIFGGGGAAFASEKSLPGDALYTLKVGFVEPLRGTFTGSAADDASWKAELITRRLSEAEALAAEGKLNKKNQQTLEILLEEHTDEYVVALQEVETNESPELADGIGTTLKASLVAHARTLHGITVGAAYGGIAMAESDPASSAGIASDVVPSAQMKVSDTSTTSGETSDTAKPDETSVAKDNIRPRRQKSVPVLTPEILEQNFEAIRHFGGKAEEHANNIRASWKSAPVIESAATSTKSDETNDLSAENGSQKKSNENERGDDSSQAAAAKDAVTATASTSPEIKNVVPDVLKSNIEKANQGRKNR